MNGILDDGERPAMFFGRVCVVVGAAIGFALLALLSFPYQLETVESIVSGNGTGCEIATTSNSGWNEALGSAQVIYPLDIIVFVKGCAGVPDGRPYDASLFSLHSGKVIARAQSCSDGEHIEEYPCRLEFPPIHMLAGSDRYGVRVVKAKGQDASVAEVRLFLKREWRSIVIDGILSA